jgi:hypothetical protein
MTLIGSLQDFNLFSIFTMIKTQNKNGTLFVENENVNIKILFDSGAIVGILSDGRDIEDDILPILLRIGIISKEELENMLKIHSQTLKSTKKIAIEYGAITLQNIQDAYHMQAMTMIYDLFLWPVADYRFDSIIADNIDRDAFLPIPIESVLMETAKFIDEWPRVQKQLPGHSQALAKTAKAADAADLVTHEEEVVLSYFEHPNSIQNALAVSRYYELETCKCIANLLERGRLEICDQNAIPPHYAADGISNIQKMQAHFLPGHSILFWPILAVCAILPIFCCMPKMLKLSINQGLRSIYSDDLIPVSNGQIEERQALVSILKNANTENGILLIVPYPSQNSIIAKEAKDAFEKYNADPMQLLLLNEKSNVRKEPKR